MIEPAARCPFCEGRSQATRRSPSLELWVWDCPCGSLGVAAPPADLDEAADELLDMLSIDLAAASLEPISRASFAQAQRPGGTSLLERLAPSVRAWGYALRRGEAIAVGDAEHWVAWARKV